MVTIADKITDPHELITDNQAFIECAVKLRPSGRRCKARIAKQS